MKSWNAFKPAARGNMEGYFLKSINFADRVLYLNETAPARLSDEEIAQARCLLGMKRVRRDGKGLLFPRRSLAGYVSRDHDARRNRHGKSHTYGDAKLGALMAASRRRQKKPSRGFFPFTFFYFSAILCHAKRKNRHS